MSPDHVSLSVDAITPIYEQRADTCSLEASQLRRRDRQLSAARGVTFFIGLAFIVGLWVDVRLGWGAGIALLAFVLLAGRHEHLLVRLREIELLRVINVRHQARRARQWRELPVPLVDVPTEHQALARDLDLFGPRSLYQWLCVAHTPMGRETLRDWLLHPASDQVIVRRQNIVRALAPERDWRESLELHGTLLGEDSQSPAEFVQWATGPAWLGQRRWLLLLARLLPIVYLLVAVAVLSQFLPLATGLWLVAALIALALLLSLIYTADMYRIFDRVAGRSDQVNHYRAMLELAARLPAGVGALDVQGRDLREVTGAALPQLARLERLVSLINVRRDGLLGLAHLAAQLVALWNVHLMAWLERWQQRYGPAVPAWFEALGQLEALASLAHAAHDHPDWCFAEIDAAADRVRAEQLGHPLIPSAARVGNDVEVGPPGTFLLVTGSNMSGKSTLLRSIGTNVMLAQAGSPVCARKLVLPPLIVESSIHVDDSLAEGVSFYLAELRRMKQIVDRARAVQQQSGARLLYLLDEILQGTNSRERQVAVVRIVRHLVEQRAIGAITTHDLELASRPELREACHVVHFRETLGWDGNRSTMSFDYLVREGVAPTTNALVLLEMVGLDQ